MNYLFTLLLLIIINLAGYSQNLSFDIHGTYTRAIKKEKLTSANTFSDLISGYPASWITNYMAAEILVINGKDVLKATGSNDTLTTIQKDILSKAELGTDIVIDVAYRYKNSITGQMDLRTMHYTATVIPEMEAEYPGGRAAMIQYLTENAIHQISDTLSKQMKQVIISFTVNETGTIANAQVSTTSGDPETDKVLLEAISNMPAWKPAEDLKGIRVKQEFEFHVGNVGC